MQILEHEDEGPFETQLNGDLPEDVEGFGLEGFGIGKGRRRLGVFDAQQMQQHEAILIRIDPDPLQTRANLGDHRLRGVGLQNAAVAPQQIEHQQIRDGGAVGNTPAFDPGHALAGELPLEFGEKPRFAYAGFAKDADRLPVAAFDLPQEIV